MAAQKLDLTKFTALLPIGNSKTKNKGKIRNKCQSQ